MAELKQAVAIPVLGNGDVWEAFDALRMMRATGCDGVIVGRGCLGRLWLFRDLADVFEGREPQPQPRLGEVVSVMRDHARLLLEFFPESLAMRHMRKWGNWYTKGFRDSAAFRVRLCRVATLAELRPCSPTCRSTRHSR
ncbi:MAG: tRNA-dihydrouridine synthase [Planctomycetota bacterium]